MPKKQTITDSLLNAMLSTMFYKFMNNLNERIRVYLFDAIRPVLKKVILAVIGASLAVIGFLFVCVSLVRYLSIHISAWMAWGLVGLFIFIIGFILSVTALKK
ncbi:hypothetical protein KAR91_22405 [Candidatus Pacearchaeota archaeon]|nr:hypothetical protein [Candidatus Pacearchaeota archaeon]